VGITITIDESLLRRMGSARGSTSRSEYIERALAEHLELRGAHPALRGMAADGVHAREFEARKKLFEELLQMHEALGCVEVEEREYGIGPKLARHGRKRQKGIV